MTVHKPLALFAGRVIGVMAVAQAADNKPNIVIIWGDDIGQFKIRAYSPWIA